MKLTVFILVLLTLNFAVTPCCGEEDPGEDSVIQQGGCKESSLPDKDLPCRACFSCSCCAGFVSMYTQPDITDAPVPMKAASPFLFYLQRAPKSHVTCLFKPPKIG